MKISRKFIAGVVATVAIILAAAAIAAAPLAKNYIERHSRELIGRTVTIGRLRMNIFTGRLRMENVVVREADDTTAFAALGGFDMKMRLLPLLNRKVMIRRIAFAAPNVTVYQRGNEFNFDDISRHLTAGKDTATDEKRPRWDIGIYDISLTGGRFSYTDLEIGAHWGFNDLNLKIPGVYFSGKNTDMGAVLEFADGGSLATELSYSVETSDYALHLRLDELALGGTLPYFRQSMNVGKVDGTLSLDMDVKGNTRHMMDFTTCGSAALSHFALSDEAGERVFRIDTLHVGLGNGSIMHRRYDFDTIYASGIGADLRIDEQGRSNILALLNMEHAGQEFPVESAGEPVDSAADSVSAAPAYDIRINRVDMLDGELSINDRSIEKPFEYSISKIVVRSQDFVLGRHNRIMASARMQRQGSAMVRWDGDMSSIDNHDILVSLSNIDLRDFSPYCEHYTAYPITAGNLTYRSQNIISDRYLKGTNHLDMFQPAADKRLKEIKPEIHVPLKLGLYVLKDKKGHVNIDLPVSGRIDSPEFSYRKIVLKALGNLLLKVVSAPFSFMFGNSDRISAIDIDPLQYAFTSEQYAKFDRLAEMIAERPEMKIAMTQKIDYDEALTRESEIILKASYYNSLQSDSTRRLDMLDFEAIEAIPLKSQQLSAYADSLLRLRGADCSSMNGSQKARALYEKEAARHLDRMLGMRDSSIMRYMASAHPGLPAGSFRTTAQSDSLKRAYRGRDRYAITVEIEGETVEVADAPTEGGDTADAASEGEAADSEAETLSMQTDSGPEIPE